VIAEDSVYVIEAIVIAACSPEMAPDKFLEKGAPGVEKGAPGDCRG
jgi:hypothetical protein